MNFTVIARTQSSETIFHHTSLLNAISQGMSLSASGKADVRIADGDGLSRTPAELFRRMFGGSSVERACDPVTSSIAEPIAA